ncbi:hypothetical protein KC363_g5883 [Hortaea werneckii]|nr:hypothetical protein KC325_g7553 [Hortaea werneckii]KAI6988165.1 hypothetical protein KC359_g7911 [Hortaea werneckii]KAI7142275.1 hypothetical protein KC344_g7324 [Hortaea werneckii]KAI7169295.1 hypothetical protein KC360_g7569 [Hortaea werneckii]KAI7187665.1 hypothetical protein KC363_g5883 [Hortaea werneckii]
MSTTVYSMGSAPMIALLLVIGVPIMTVPIITCAGIYCIRRWRRKQDQTKQQCEEQESDEEASPTIPEIQMTLPPEAADKRYMRDARAASPFYNGRNCTSGLTVPLQGTERVFIRPQARVSMPATPSLNGMVQKRADMPVLDLDATVSLDRIEVVTVAKEV